MLVTRGRRPGAARRTTALGAFLVAVRRAKGWSQTRLREELIKANDAFGKNTPEQYVSKIETGAVQFPARDEFWEALAKLTGRSRDELQQMARQPEVAQVNDSLSVAIGSTEEGVVTDAQRFVAEVGPKNLDIWLLGPQSLPVVKNDVIQNIWIDNLAAGATYNVIWFLDQVDAHEFAEVSSVLANIGARVRERQPSGQAEITHYATQLLTASKATDFKAVTSEYDKMRVAELEGNKFFVPLLEDSELRSLKERLQLFWQKFSAIVVYCPRKPGFKTRANLRLMSVRSRPDEEPTSSPFFWFSYEHAFELEAMLSQFRKIYEERRPSKNGKSPKVKETMRATK